MVLILRSHGGIYCIHKLGIFDDSENIVQILVSGNVDEIFLNSNVKLQQLDSSSMRYFQH